MNVCVRLAPDKTEPKSRFAIIPFGRSLRRFITLQAERGYAYMLLEDLVSMFVERFFQGERVLECVPFRITRNADIVLQDDSAADLLSDMEEVLAERKKSDCVRLEVTEEASLELLNFLQNVRGHCSAGRTPLPSL
jgi:polyphosphate kinase